ncbi:glycosyltransferase family 25 protein [Pseudomonas mangiferae]|uniref:glycosyltransferase family 25 protein n=1 Tax=Pseudomonas mangiferae TaxID=2593654 RepID=UPI001E434F59|nr:glycosyltransferase family 25 protein [Pseudomonas mangiferae]
MSSAPSFLDHVFVINLDSRADRWAEMQRQFARFGIVDARRFPAIRPGLEIVERDELARLHTFLRYTDGDSPSLANKVRATWGCMQSHLGAIRQAQEAGLPYALILEDDCVFEPYTLPVLRQVERQLQGVEWDLLYLGGTLKKGGRRSRFSANLKRVSRVRLAHAYVVHARLFSRILAEASRSGLPLDWYYSENLQPEVATFMVSPTLANQRLNDLSDIEAVSRQPKLKFRKALVRCWSRIRYWSHLC